MKIRFHGRLYPRSALDEAAAAFSGVARCSIRREGQYYEVDIEADQDTVDDYELAGEFSNYVLGGTIAQRGKR